MGEKITDYSSISTTNPNKLSLIDVSELLGNSTYDTRSMSLEKLANYINPIPYPSSFCIIIQRRACCNTRWFSNLYNFTSKLYNYKLYYYA